MTGGINSIVLSTLRDDMLISMSLFLIAVARNCFVFEDNEDHNNCDSFISASAREQNLLAAVWSDFSLDFSCTNLQFYGFKIFENKRTVF